jgi:glycosyltransferase involved in cell wall biosynthesis
MKILHAGNLMNLGYINTKYLRNVNIDAELLMEIDPPVGSDPLPFDSTLNNKFPPWINFYNKKKSSWKFQIIKKMREKQYDLIHAYVELPIFSYLSRKPFIVQTQGSDFRELALTNSIRGILLRRAYKKAKLIILSQADHTKLISKFKLNNTIFMPMMCNTDFFSPKHFEKKLVEDKFVVFHPTRQNWKGKKNYILIQGFAKFVKKYSNSILVVLNFGPDSNKVKELVSSLGIEKNVHLIEQRLDSMKLLEYYNRCDVIADQFGITGSIGSTTLEAMSCEKPLLISVDKKLHRELYGEEIPAMRTVDPDSVSNALEILQDDAIRRNIGQSSRKWVLKHHSTQVIIKKLQIIYSGISNGESIINIREKLVLH